MTFHSALNIVFDLLKRAHWHVQKSPVLKAVLSKPPRVAFRNQKTLRYKLVHSKLKLTDDAERGNFPRGRGNCESCNILKLGKEFKSAVTGEIYNGGVVYLITCKVCKREYTGSTATKFCARFNQYKSNLKLYGEGRRGFFQEMLTEHFFNHGHNGSYKKMMVQFRDFCDPNDQEKREEFWMDKLGTFYPEGLNMKRINQ